MPRKAPCPPQTAEDKTRTKQSQHAFERVLEEIHEDHRELEGDELYQAVLEIFGLTAPPKQPGEPK